MACSGRTCAECCSLTAAVAKFKQKDSKSRLEMQERGVTHRDRTSRSWQHLEGKEESDSRLNNNAAVQERCS